MTPQNFNEGVERMGGKGRKPITSKHVFTPENNIANSQKENNMDWDNAKKYLEMIEEQYHDFLKKLHIGIPALTLIISPLRTRFDAGEKTKELYDEIMNLG